MKQECFIAKYSSRICELGTRGCIATHFIEEKPMEVLATKFSIYKKGDNAFFGKSVTTVELDDEAAGAFIIVSQDGEERTNELRFDFEEIDTFCEILKQLKDVGSSCES